MHITAATVLALSTLPKTFCVIDALTSTAMTKRFPVGSTIWKNKRQKYNRYT